MNAIFQSFSIGSNVWLTKWSDDKTTVVNDTVDTVKRDTYLGVYGALGLGQGMFTMNLTKSYKNYLLNFTINQSVLLLLLTTFSVGTQSHRRFS